MTEDEKKPYTSLAKKDKKRHDAQIDELKKNGYFMMEDGSKSLEHQKKVKLHKKPAP